MLSNYYARTTGNSRFKVIDGSARNAAVNPAIKSNYYRAGSGSQKEQLYSILFYGNRAAKQGAKYWVRMCASYKIAN